MSMSYTDQIFKITHAHSILSYHNVTVLSIPKETNLLFTSHHRNFFSFFLRSTVCMLSRVSGPDPGIGKGSEPNPVFREGWIRTGLCLKIRIRV